MPRHDFFNIKTYFKTLADGDMSGFETFYDLYKKRVFGVVLKMLPQRLYIDAGQKTVQKLLLPGMPPEQWE